jgi:hypothetical protein
MKDEALRLALEALKQVRDANIIGLTLTQDYYDAITAIKAVLEAKDEPDYKALWQQMCERCDELDNKLAQSEHGWTPERIAGMARLKAQQDSRLEPQRIWVGLMRGVRVEGNAVVITVKGGNNEARALCGELINEMEKNT